MKITLGKKLFIFTSATVSLLLLATFLILERSQSRHWEEYLREQSLSFARFATPEVLKRFRGSFPSHVGNSGEGVEEWLAFNRDLIRFELISPTGRVLFRSQTFPGFQNVDSKSVSDEDLERRLAASEFDVKTARSQQLGRVLDILAPAHGPTGEHVLSVRYLMSFRSIDLRLQEMRLQFLRIALISIGISLVLVAFVARRTTQPIKELTDGARAVARGDLGTRISARRGDEIGTLAASFNDMAQSLARSQAELSEKNRALLSANEELRAIQEQMIRAERLAAIGELAAGVSHEIDNPVGIILGYAELLLDDLDEGDPRREDVQAIIDECKRCRRITGGLLGFARTAPSRKEPVVLNSLLEQTLATLRPQKLFKEVEIRLTSPPEPLVVTADPDQLRQVLINLFLNAAQAMEGKGRLEVDLCQEDGRAEVRVSDTGSGIPPEMRETIFAPFFSTKPRGKGTGLGLSVCRKLVEDHAGRLWAEQGRGGGACFVMEIPLEIQEKYFDIVPRDSLG